MYGQSWPRHYLTLIGFCRSCFVSTPEGSSRWSCPCLTTTICMRMRMHECFQMQQILVKVGLGSILIKRLGHPTKWAKGLRRLQINARCETNVRTKASNPRSFLWKIVARDTTDRKSLGEIQKTHKDKEHAATSLIAPASKHNIVWRHQSSRVKVALRHPCW